jgi:hypothetical protein
METFFLNKRRRAACHYIKKKKKEHRRDKTCQPLNGDIQMPRSNREYIYGLPLSCILTVLNKE